MYITATGMVCAVGLNAASACAAMRAGIANFVELPYRANQGEPIIGAPVPDVPFSLKGNERLVELLTRAIIDCLKNQPKESFDRVPLLVGLAEPDRPGGGAELALTIIGQIQDRLNIRFHPTLSRAFAKGHTSGFEALAYTQELFRAGSVFSCVVCGVDSYLTATSLLWLDQHWRLKRTDNSDGVIPGEGAAVVLAQRELSTKSEPNTRVVGVGFAHESAHVLSEEPLLGKGLAEAARKALQQAQREIHEVDFRISDASGESYGLKEQALLLSKLLRRRREEFPIWHCVDSMGDSGAASGISQVAVVNNAITGGHALGTRVLCCTGSVNGERACLVMEG